MSEFIYKIKKQIVTLSDNGKLSTELNVVRFGNSEPKYDLRRWRRFLSSGEKKMQKGVTMTAEEVVKLRDALNSLTL